jgi:tetratricopeptide (TPR) repeat protein
MQSAEALALAQKARDLSESASPKEKALINAMLVRYSADTSISRATLNAWYGEEMKKAYAAFPNDADVSALYSDALLVQHPWEYWKHSGEAQPWTPEILAVLEHTLKISPEHPGANHYYIHATEASTHPGRALPSADRLGRLMPEVSHMVHMPSHVFIRTGHYEKGVRVNEMSISGYNAYTKIYPAVANNTFLYLIHNLHMQTACAMLRPNYALSLRSAFEARNSFDTSLMLAEAPLGNFIQYVYMSPMIVNVRYGKWNDILNAEKIPDSFKYAKVLWHWAKGLANANTGKMIAAKESLKKMRMNMRYPDLKIVMTPFNSVHSSALVAEKILEGTIFEKTGDLKKAIAAYREAMDFEDALIYTEPRDWMIPTRHYLANALIRTKAYAEAEKLLKQDLQTNPSNFYALHGLATAAKLQRKDKEAASYEALLKKAFTEPDVPGPSLIY